MSSIFILYLCVLASENFFMHNIPFKCFSNFASVGGDVLVSFLSLKWYQLSSVLFFGCSSYLCELCMDNPTYHSGYIVPGYLQFYFFDPEFIYVIAYCCVFINMFLSYHKYFYRLREFLLLLCHLKFGK